MRLNNACPRFLSFARGWEDNSSADSPFFLFLYLAKASAHWVLAPSTISSRSLTSVNLLIIFANALMTGSTEDAGGGMAGGGVTAQGGPEDFSLILSN